MNPHDYYFEIMPCDNGWNIKQLEWCKDGRYEKTQSFVFNDLDDAMECVKNMLQKPVSYLKQYD